MSAPRVRLSAQLPPTARHDEEGHEALRDLFDRFELTTTEAGVEVRPVLSAGTTARILDGLQEWPNGLRYGSTYVPETARITKTPTLMMVTHRAVDRGLARSAST